MVCTELQSLCMNDITVQIPLWHSWMTSPAVFFAEALVDVLNRTKHSSNIWNCPFCQAIAPQLFTGKKYLKYAKYFYSFFCKQANSIPIVTFISKSGHSAKVHIMHFTIICPRVSGCNFNWHLKIFLNCQQVYFFCLP